MPRRYFDYPPEFRSLNIVSTVGSWILFTGLVIIFGNLIRSLRRGPRAPQNPWGGRTLEWQIPSPPPAHNFDRAPVFPGQAHADRPFDFETEGGAGG